MATRISTSYKSRSPNHLRLDRRESLTLAILFQSANHQTRHSEPEAPGSPILAIPPQNATPRALWLAFCEPVPGHMPMPPSHEREEVRLTYGRI